MPSFWSQQMEEMTLGEKRVRTKFNPSADEVVDQIKQKTAELIDLCNSSVSQMANDEERRLWALAMTHYEDAAMWSVKACTYGK
jgi:hypothetical protein